MPTMNSTFLGAVIGFTIANYTYQFFGAGIWAAAHERTFFQLTALGVVWATLAWRENFKVARRS